MRHSNQMPKPPQIPLNAEEQQSYTELIPDVQAFHPVSKPADLRRKLIVMCNAFLQGNKETESFHKGSTLLYWIDMVSVD